MKSPPPKAKPGTIIKGIGPANPLLIIAGFILGLTLLVAAIVIAEHYLQWY